jgi:hypothetical protein
MRHPIRWTLLWVAVGALAGVGVFLWQSLSQPLVLDAPAPLTGPDLPDTAPQPRASVVDAPIAYDLSGIVDSLEATVPRMFGDLTQRLQAGDNRRTHFAFAVERSPFSVRANGLTVTVSTDVEYEGRVWYDPFIGPEISAACGTGGVPRPRVRATLVSTARITSDWRVVTRTRVSKLEPYSDDPRDHCRITIFHIDITNRVIDATRHMLEQKLTRFDRSVARWDARGWFDDLWQRLARPIRFTDSVYLLINPFAAQLGAVRSRGDTIMAQLRLIAAPQIVTGLQQVDSTRHEPLPRLDHADSMGTGASVLMEASFEYPVATHLLRRVLVGRTVEESGHRVRIRDVELTGIGGGRVALGVWLTGAIRGRLYFTGTPRLDRENRQVYVPDLDYDVGSANMLVRGFEWLRGDQVRDFLRERARLPDSALLGKLTELAERGMNRSLSPGVELSARIFNAAGTGVRATTTDLRVRAVADAELRLEISRAPKLPRLPSRAGGAPPR